MNRAETGRRGEAAAARWYQKQGCRLLTHNFHTRMGELDVVVQEPDGTIVICEVKTRAEGSLASPAEAVDRPKQRRLIRAAEAYLQRTGLSDAPVRFDVAEVYFASVSGSQIADIRYIANAFAPNESNS